MDKDQRQQSANKISQKMGQNYGDQFKGREYEEKVEKELKDFIYNDLLKD